ncbi:hypothetical protein VB773_16435 [Haloarculaceae archaeon H-GB2-1]|nr:hypothetical protein [Haloarculaceae archaeon H-GB1-1]MEA5387517.1 hypothetical protein [Haloarculaceae archaeon H-GB11]MEA5408999.1 hypothetical protein [Haloarculaceae archaeon H-GB2-1]
MATRPTNPGPNAHAAFKFGMRAAVVAAAGVLGLLYLSESIEVSQLIFLVVVLFPIYLVLAASVLSVWLGYNKDTTDLRPVTREQRAR